MTFYYVSSVSGSNANDGSSSANAKKYLELDDGNSSLLNDTGITLADGDTIYIDSAHVERYAADAIIDFGAVFNVDVYSIDWSALPTFTYEAGVTFGNNSDAYAIEIDTTNKAVAVYGCDFRAAGTDYVTMRFGGYYEDCTFAGRSVYGYDMANNVTRFVNCTFEILTSTAFFNLVASNHTIIFENCTFTGTLNPYIFSHYNSGRISSNVQFINCDFSACSALTHIFGTTYLLGNNPTSVRLLVKNCKLPSGCELFDAVPELNSPYSFTATMIGSYNGSTSVPQNWNMETYTGNGKVAANSSTKRLDGATDGQTSFSWKLEPAESVCYSQPLHTPRMSSWTPPMSGDITVYLVSDIPLTDRDCWLEINSPDSANPAYAQGEFISTKETPLGSGTTLVSSSGNWTNSLTYEHKISREVVTSEAGLINAQLAVSNSGATIYLDSVIHTP